MTLTASPSAPALGDVSLLTTLNVLLAARRLLIGLALGFALIAGMYGILRERKWTSTASFVPQGRRSSNVTNLAAQFGVATAAGEPAQSPLFYADLAASREILGRMLDSTYPARNGRVALDSLLDVFHEDSLLRRDITLQRLRGAISTEVTQRTGVVRLAVTVPDPVTAQAVASRLLALLNDFNLATRQSQAGAERRFAERRLRELGEELAAAEERVRNFEERNRDLRSSPQLALAYDRLRRRVSSAEVLYTTMAQSYEQARLDEVRDTPVLTVIERPNVPVRPNARGTVLLVLGAACAGIMTGALWTISRILLASGASAGGRDSADFRRLLAETREDLLRFVPWRRR